MWNKKEKVNKKSLKREDTKFLEPEESKHKNYVIQIFNRK